MLGSIATTTVAVAASLDLLYHFVALVFVGMWGERPKFVQSSLIRLGLWTVLYLVTVVGGDYLAEVNAVSMHGSLVFLLCWKLLVNTRQTVVEGGTKPTFHVSNKTIVISGANAGIGLETVKALHENKTNRIFLLCRSPEKAHTAIEDINYHKNLIVIRCDLCDFASIRRAVEEIRKQTDHVHILINNAGVMLKDRSTTKDGFETTLQANYLGHFLLTSLLLPIIRDRIINLSSSTYQLSRLTDDLEYALCKDWYSLFGQYSNTKLLNIWHTQILARKFPHLKVAAVHPGLVRTDVVKNLPLYLKFPNQVFGIFLSALQKTPEQGAWGTLFCCNGDYLSGKYWVNREVQDTKAPNLPRNFWQWSINCVKLTDLELKELENKKSQ